MRTWPRMQLVIVVALLAAACGGDDGGSTPDDGEEATGQAEAADVAVADVAVADTELGEILVDDDGMTLYLFTNDPEGESVCVDDCAVAWPPLTVDGDPVAGDGVDGSMIGTIERDDGGTQVTYAGAPLYTWAQDEEPGDVTGQGVQDVWFVVAPDGTPISDVESDAAGPAANY